MIYEDAEVEYLRGALERIASLGGAQGVLARAQGVLARAALSEADAIRRHSRQSVR